MAIMNSDPWQLQIIQLLHLQLNITRAKRFGSTVFTLMYQCIFSFLLLKKELIEIGCFKILAEFMDLIYFNEIFKLINVIYYVTNVAMVSFEDFAAIPWIRSFS